MQQDYLFMCIFACSSYFCIRWRDVSLGYVTVTKYSRLHQRNLRDSYNYALIIIIIIIILNNKLTIKIQTTIEFSVHEELVVNTAITFIIL